MRLLRQFTHGHTGQLASVARTHLVNLVAADHRCYRGSRTQAYVDIDSLLRPVYGHAKQGASFGHTKIAGALLWKCRSDPSDLLTSPTVAASSPAPAAVPPVATSVEGSRWRGPTAWVPHPDR